MPHGDATKAPTPLRKPGAPTPAKGAAKPITRKRRIGRMILVTLGLLTATVFVVNWTGLAKAFIVPKVEKLLGCTVSADRVTIDITSGEIVIARPALDAPQEGLADDVTRFLEADSLRLMPDWGAMIHGRFELTSVSLFRPVIRLSQGPAMALNVRPVIDALSTAGGSGVSITKLPSVDIVGAVIELGEHTIGSGSHFSELASVRVQGSVIADARQPGRYKVMFTEEPPPAGPAGAGPKGKPSTGAAWTPMKLDGWIDLAKKAADARLTDVDLSEWGKRTAPSDLREIWQSMKLGGQIPQISFTYDGTRGIAASFDLERVDLSIPVLVEPDWDSRGDPVPGAQSQKQPLAMRQVTGRIRFDSTGLDAELSGGVEDLPLVVRLKTQGLGLNCGLACDIESRNFQLEKRPRLLPFAPPFIRLLFQRFTSPTAEAEGLVKVTRAAPGASGEAAPLQVAGTIRFKNCAASHELFMYPIANLSGVVNFDDKKVELLNIKGSHPSGAKLLASGTIAPPDDTAAADVRVTVVDLPLDELFVQALPARRQEVFRALFCQPKYDELREEGRIQSSQDHAAREKEWNQIETDLALAERGGWPAARIDELKSRERRLQDQMAIPVFDLGGKAQMEVHVSRELGADSYTHADVSLSASTAGLLLKAFPLPIFAEGVELEMTGTKTTMKPIKLRGISGGTGLLTGRIEYPSDGPLNPVVDIVANDLPVDAALARALPGSETAIDGRISARRVVSAMHFSGTVGGTVLVRADELDPSNEGVRFSADLATSNLDAEPGAGGLLLCGLAGGLHIDDDGVIIPQLCGMLADSPIGFSLLSTGSAARGEATIFAHVDAANLDLSLPLERVVEPGAPQYAPRVARIRGDRHAEGHADFALDVSDSPQGAAAFIRIAAARDVGFDTPVGRALVTTAAGGVGFTDRMLQFDDLSLTLPSPGDAAAAAVRLDGGVSLDDSSPARLEVWTTGARFESPLVRSLAEQADERIRTFTKESDPRGAFDGHAVIWRKSPGGPVTAEGFIEPHSFMFTRRTVDVMLDPVSGRVAFSPDTVKFQKLSANAPKWSVSADGSWTGEEGLDLVLSMKGDAIPADLRAALPQSVSEAMGAVELADEGSFSMHDARVKLSPAGVASFSGDIKLEGVALQPVVPIKEASGTVRVSAPGTKPAPVKGAPPGDAPVELEVTADSFRLAGLRLTAGRARVLADPKSGRIEVPRFEASAHGGRLTASGGVVGVDAPRPENSVPTNTDRRAYEFGAEFSDIRFGDLLSDISPKGALDESSQPPVNRGVLDGSFNVAGVLGDMNSRRGRGLVRVTNGEVLNMPAVVPILRLSNLQAPVGERVGFGYADFHIQGDKLKFDDFTLQSKSLAIAGSGDITWPGLDLNMTFVTRSLDRVPLLTDLIEGVRDELVTTVVSGKLYDPQLKYSQLTATKKMLKELFGSKRRQERPAPSSDQPLRPPDDAGVQAPRGK